VLLNKEKSLWSVCGLLVCLVLASVGCSVQSREGSEGSVNPPGSLPADRFMDWSKAGVWVGEAKGIPVYPVGVTCAPPAYSVYPNQAADSRAGIQAALDACQTGQAVYLPVGTYRVGGRIDLKSGVSLRGAGPGLTTIQAVANNVYFSANALDAVSDAITDPGSGPDARDISGPISSGSSKGSSTVVVSAALAANLAAGQTVLINQLNDDYVTHHGTGDDCIWAGGNGLRALGETKIVASKSGTSITFTTPLYHEYPSRLQPKLIRMASSPIRNAGIENLTFDGGSGSSARSVFFLGAAHCWVKTVEFKGWDGIGVEMWWGTVGCEVTDCYFHDATAFGGSQGYCTAMIGNSTDNSVYNNIAKWVKLLAAVGSAGGTANVVAYNYCHSTNHYAPHWGLPECATHGAHTLMNLFEGNEGPMVQLDGYHGSGSHNICFRNAFTGIYNNPSVASNMICAAISDLNSYITFIGNVLGHSGMTGVYETDPYVEQNILSIWKRGTDPFLRSTLIRHGNYDYVTNTTVWDESITDRQFPASLYLNSRPAWFGNLDWPAIGPDVTGYKKAIPAKRRWEAYVGSNLLSDLFAR